MPLPRSDPDGDWIVAHLPFVRALARELVFDAQLAKDVEQEVLLAALQNSPRDLRSFRGWLAALVRNLASKSFRARSRRDARERMATPASVPTPVEILAREDLRRNLVEHVLALEEPVRAVMILRFFEDLPPREVARRLGIPVETVRTRTKRGVELLRARLQRERGGGRDAWCLALVTGLKVEPPSLIGAGLAVLGASWSGVLAMAVSKKLAALVAIVVLAGAGWFGFSRPGPVSPPEASLARGPRPDDVVAPEPEAPSSTLQGETRKAIESSSSTAATVTPATTEGALRLRLHWFDGTPAGGVNARILRGGPDLRDDALVVQSGADGARLVEALVPGEYEVHFDRGHSERCVVVAGETTEVEVTFVRGFDVAGRVVERGGGTVPGAEILLHWYRREHVVALADSSGRFEVRSLRAGVQWISARAPLHGPSQRRELIGDSGGIDDLELVLEPAGASLEGVVQDAEGEPLAHARVLIGPEAVFDRVHFEDGARGLAPPGQVVECDERGRFAFAGIPVGHHRLQAIGKRHSPWSGEIEALDRRTVQLLIRLERCATLEGRVTDGLGQPIARAEVRGNGDGLFASRYARTAADGTFALTDLPAQEFGVSVTAEGFEPAKTALAGAPGAQLLWSPILVPGTSILGRLTMGDTDFSQWSVHCESQDAPRGDFQQPSFRAMATPAHDGSFEIRGCRPGPHTLTARAPDGAWSFPCARVRNVSPGAAELLIPIDPACLETCHLRGRIVDELGAPLAGIQFIVARQDSAGAPLRITEPDGTFEMGPVPTGIYVIGVHAAGFAPFSSEKTEVIAGSTWDFGDLRLSRGGTISVNLLPDAGCEQLDVEVSASVPGSGTSFSLPVLGTLGRSEVLAPGEYLVSLWNRDDLTRAAQRSARVTVRVGEETRVSMRVELGIPTTIAFHPPEVTESRLRALDAGGALLWEGAFVTGWKLTLPRSTVRLEARDAAGRTAEATLDRSPSLARWDVTLRMR